MSSLEYDYLNDDLYRKVGNNFYYKEKDNYWPEFSSKYNELKRILSIDKEDPVKGNDVCILVTFNNDVKKLWNELLTKIKIAHQSISKDWNDEIIIFNKKLIDLLKKYNLPYDDNSMEDQPYGFASKYATDPNPPSDTYTLDNLLLSIDLSDPDYSNCK